jgi:manganese/zinc/iron transport system substrate-binding protein
MRRRSFLAGVGFVFLVGCHAPNPVAAGKLKVVATTSIVADLAIQIGGEHVRVTAIMPPGVDPHRYTPLPADTIAIANADLVLYSGLHLEGKMVDVLERATVNGRTPVAVTRELSTQSIRLEGNEADPHVWFDVALWAKTIPTVQRALSNADPAHAADYAANAERYARELDAIDAEVKSTLATLPKDRRVLVTSHDAFGYFGRAYGFEVQGLQGISTASEVGLDDRRQLADLLTTKNIPAVFGETSVPTKGLQAVLDTVKSKTGRTVKLIGGSDALYSDSLGPPGSQGATYVGMVRHNATIIAGALKP